MNQATRFMLFVLLVVGGIKGSEQLYRLVAFRDERAEVRVLRERLLDAGAELTVVRTESKRLREALSAEDEALEREHERLERYSRRGTDGMWYVPSDRYERYRREMEAYNRHVVERNALFRELLALGDRHNHAADSYNSLADSIRDLAARMGEPYYSVPTPLEAYGQRTVILPQQR